MTSFPTKYRFKTQILEFPLFFSDALLCGSDGPIVAVVCGGSMASLQMFETWRERLGMSEEDVM